MDFAAEGLLDGLQADKRSAREQLLRQLVADGYTLEELTRAVHENRLALLRVDRVLRGTYTAEEIERQTGLPAELMVRLRRLHGLPAPDLDSRVFSDEDIEAARSASLLIEAGLEEEQMTEVMRVLGEGMARLSATITAAVADTFLKAGDSEEYAATRLADLAQLLIPATVPMVLAGYKAHLRDSVELGVLGPAELDAGDIGATRDLTVCFADLVGYTRLGGSVEVRELATVARRLAQLAAAVAESPVRLVKTIGDAAMFVSQEPAALIDVALTLIEAFDDEDLPSLRAGLAHGPASIRAGDFYGNAVNLASRVTGVARPGTVLCTKDVRDAARERFEWSSAGRHKLKGVSGPTPLYRARPVGDAEHIPSEKPAGSRPRGRRRS